jgi:acyl-CoA synthetase (AMP-forming)/AMP-acid ligase II
VIIVPREFRGYDYPAMVERLRGDWPDLAHVLVVDGPSWREFLDTPWEERRDPAELSALRPDPNDVTLVIFTSGTTGEPKGVMHTHNTLMAANAPLPGRLGVGPHSVIHMASTFAHLTGFLYGARLPTQVGGATAVYQDVWRADEFVELVESHRISYTSAATPFLLDTLNVPDLASRDLSSLERFCCMGAPIPRAVVRDAKRKLPGLAVLGGWGQTEDALVTLGIPGDPEEKIVERDGYPWPGMRIRVVDGEGRPQPAGKEGDLQVTGPFLFAGYLHRPELTQAGFDGEWFRTGDLAMIDEDGYLSITGRTKDMIIRGGENIPVAYVENVLYEHPDLADVALVGLPDPRLQERACAAVTLKPGADGFDLARMREFLGTQGVARQYWPERVEVFDALPRTASGKIRKFELREQLAR